MYTTAIFLEYMAALFSVLLGLALIVMLNSKRIGGRTRTSRRLLLYSGLVLAICLFNFALYYSDRVLHIYSVPALFRAIDYLLSGLAAAAWFFVIDSMVEKARSPFCLAGAALSLFHAACSMIVAVRFMDSYYHLQKAAAHIYPLTDYILFFLRTLLLLACVVECVRGSGSKRQKLYVLLTSLVYALFSFWYRRIMGQIYTGSHASGWQLGVSDIGGLFILLLSILSFAYVFSEYFLPLLSGKQEAEGDPLQEAALQYHLTDREAEIMGLIYEGQNSSQIAEQLNISPNTVKKHTQNIYNKAGVNSRMALAYLINHQKQGTNPK